MPDLEEAATETRKEKDARKAKPQRDAAREAVETVVFVVVLVLLLKLFVTEAFVIPTGSMAETLYGYHKMVTCPKCGFEFPVNSHDEVEGNQVTGHKTPLYGFTCPNCRYLGHVNELKPIPDNQSGDRVLVLKPLYNIENPRRGDVVVFKYPEKPQEKQTASNYIKRAQGFGGETVAIFRGDLYVTTSLKYPESDRFPRPTDPLKLWEPQYMYSTVNDPEANPEGVKLFTDSRAKGFPPGPNGLGTGGFEIVRKGERQLLADRRIVWDNDKQPKELAGKVPPRWYVYDGKEFWKQNDLHQPQAFSHDSADRHWIRYRHLAETWKTNQDKSDPSLPTNLDTLGEQHPTKIDNFLGYNAGRDIDPVTGIITERSNKEFDTRWVGDLILECDVEIQENGSEAVLELSKGINRFQAVFGNGKVTLKQTGRGSDKFKEPSRPCKVTSGKYRVRFANVDCKLWVWVDGRCIDFGDESNYQPVETTPENDHTDPDGWTQENDVDAPASIGVNGKGIISHITLHRDIYYTRSAGNATPADLFYVQPGHYLCLGDNSAQSSDSRKWGTVPERLMLGKAVFVFFPIRGRMGFIH